MKSLNDKYLVVSIAYVLFKCPSNHLARRCLGFIHLKMTKKVKLVKTDISLWFSTNHLEMVCGKSNRNISFNQFYIFGYFNSLPPCWSFWLSFLLSKCMPVIIFLKLRKFVYLDGCRNECIYFKKDKKQMNQRISLE